MDKKGGLWGPGGSFPPRALSSLPVPDRPAYPQPLSRGHVQAPLLLVSMPSAGVDQVTPTGPVFPLDCEGPEVHAGHGDWQNFL